MTIQQETVAVFGGTGNQGSAVVRSLLLNKSNTFEVRVITRDVNSPVAKELVSLGAKTVCADARDSDQLAAAFSGAWGAFINSNSDYHGPEHELHLPNVFDFDIAVLNAAQAAGVRHVVYSSGANIHRATKGRVSLAGFDCKSYAEEYARSNALFTTFTALLPASFMECWTFEPFCETWGGFPLAPKENGDIVLAMPPYGGDGRMPWVSVQDDFGDIVHGILLDPVRYDKRRVQAISTLVVFEDMARAFTSATGTPVQFQPLSSWTEVPQDGSQFRRECSLMFFYMEHCGGRWFAEYPSDDAAARECKEAAANAQGNLKRTTISFEEWFARQHKERLSKK
ncbi:hypothetical protein N7449_008970 [Penicillium cf. viridicatum]|uniref:NmrA-like domain-containing protein n=1 Tax=Penicillium cf. viridicatum TaxID=2972119 RepID=A0A9W9J9X3_9EURO|nr:hypothetical protein N7449_008970 [Penicillium cf. viridicatum]